MTEFSTLLAGVRRKRGYATAYAFFTRNGGSRGLGMTYGAYWKIEKGKILPQGGRLSVLLTCLGLAPESPEARDLLRAYLKTSLGSEQVLDWVLDAFGPARAAAPASLGEKATERLLHENLYRLTPKQNQAVLSGYAAYWAYEVLTTDASPRETADLARELGVALAEMKAALAKLAANRIVKLAGSAVSSPLAGRHIHMVPETSWTREERARLAQFQERLARSRGNRVARAYVVARAEAGDLASYVPHLRKAVCEFLVHSSREKTPSSSLFLIEGSVHRLLE